MSKKRAASSSPSASARMKSSPRSHSSSSSSFPPRWEAVELDHGGLSLVPRLRVLLSFVRTDLSVRPLDEWQLRESLLDFLRDSLSISVSDKDLSLHKHKNPHKRRNDEALASGVLYIWDVQGLIEDSRGCREDADFLLQEKEHMIIEKLTGVELNLGGLKLTCHARPEDRDDFFALKRSWKLAHETQETGSPDTMVLRGIPSRWLAELRVSSKASVLVTHSIMSQFGSVRNLDIKVNDSESLSCNIWVQFEHYSEFYKAMVAFCGRSMEKEGSNFKANYEVNWDNNGYFTEGNIRKRKFEQQRLEESRRRQALMEARQAEISRSQGELARFEQDRKEAERIERVREEENWRRERQAALAEQEMLRQKEMERVQEEERLRKEKFRREKLQREEEQKALEIRRREEYWKLEEQMKEKQKAEMQQRETWTRRSLRHISPEIVNSSHLDASKRMGNTGYDDDERWAHKYAHASSNGNFNNNHHREYFSKPSHDRSWTRGSEIMVEDFKGDFQQRWALDTGPPPLSRFAAIKSWRPAYYRSRLKSVIVDSRPM